MGISSISNRHKYACWPDEGLFPCGDGQCVEDFDKC
ncbi:unnamed protein product, partial [Rotaria magnacalcarata]